MQDRVGDEGTDPVSLHEDAVGKLEPLELAVEAVEPTRAGNIDFLSQQNVQVMIASALQSFMKR